MELDSSSGQDVVFFGSVPVCYETSLLVRDQEDEDSAILKVCEINSAFESAVKERVEEATKELEETLEAVEYEVAKVYCEITDGRMSKANYKAEAVIAEANDIGMRETEEAVREAEDRVWEEAAKIVIANHLSIPGIEWDQVASALRARRSK